MKNLIFLATALVRENIFRSLIAYLTLLSTYSYSRCDRQVDWSGSLISSEGRLVRVGDVQEAIWVLPLLVDFTHHVLTLEDVAAIDEEVEWVLLGKTDSLADDEAELISGQVARG